MIEAVIDYAYPAMMAEKALNQMHRDMLALEYDKAMEQALVALAETKLALSAIKHMKERKK